MMMSTTRPNRVFRANSSPFSASRCTSLERIAGSEQVRDQVVAAIGRKGQVADLLRRVERAPQQLAAGRAGASSRA